MDPNILALYKILVEWNMNLPNRRPDTMSEKCWKDLLELYERTSCFLQMEFNFRSEIEAYIEKFEHFVHLFFAYDKYDLENKFKENVTVVYIEHRRPTAKDLRKKYSTPYGVYQFKLSDNVDELVTYGKVVIDGHLGTVTNINVYEKTIDVAFEDTKGKIIFDDSKKYTIDIQFNDHQYKIFLRSLQLLKNGKATFAIFPNSEKLETSYEDYQRGFNFYYEKQVRRQVANKFDRMQNQAIYSIVKGTHGTVPFVLWGPPGTGKTVTIIECIKQLLLNENNKILICTPSNMAADLIARRVYKDGILPPSQMRRYYSLGKNVNDRDRELDEIIKMENCALYGMTDERFGLDSFKEILRLNIRLIFSTLTCSGYLEEEIKNEDFFSHIFIDEASQSFEPETLIPITRFATENTRVILCGDYQQLGAVCKPYFLKRHKQTCGSLMERLMTTPLKDYAYTDGRTYCKLNESYRCHPHIIEFSSVNFYNGELIAVKEKERTGFCQWKYLPRKNFPLILHVVSKGVEVKQLDGGRSFSNEEEVDVVIKYIKLIKETMSDIKDSEIGVISPYKQQTQKIRQQLSKNREIIVDSVECFQGSERRVIIISLSRSEQLGFLSEYKRINTSFTRAKELLIVIVSQAFINLLDPKKPNNHWKKFIEFCIENNAITIDKFVSEDGCDISPEEMDLFKQKIMSSLQTNLTMRIERPGPRIKQQSSSPQAINLLDDSNEEISPKKASPVRKLHGVHSTPLFKMRPSNNGEGTSSRYTNNKSTNEERSNISNNNIINEEWLSDDDDAATEYWANHFSSNQPTHQRPYLSNYDNNENLSDDDDNISKMSNNSKSNLKNAKKDLKEKKKKNEIKQVETHFVGCVIANQFEPISNEVKKVNKRLVPIINSSTTNNINSRLLRNQSTTVAEQIKFRGMNSPQKISKSPTITSDPYSVRCLDYGSPSGQPDLSVSIGTDLASISLDEQQQQRARNSMANNLRSGSTSTTESTPKKTNCIII